MLRLNFNIYLNKSGILTINFLNSKYTQLIII